MEEINKTIALKGEHKENNIINDVHSKAAEGPSPTHSTLPAFPYRDSFDDDDDDDGETTEYYFSERRRRRTFVGRILGLLGMNVRKRRRQSTDHDRSYPKEGVLLKGKPRHVSPREGRKCRRSVTGTVRRICLAVPIVVLMFFGAIHLLEVLLGRARLFWDLDAYESFLPDWASPGGAGEDLAHYPTDATRDVIPLRCHSHNDYWRKVPLYDALHWGCTGVEADVWLFDEELYVGHNTASLTRNRTFRNLYINPLVALIDAMNPNNTFGATSGHGVFDADPDQSLTLLVDFKTNGRITYPYVQKQLQGLREKDYLTYYDGEKLHKRAVTVVGTGNTPFDMVVNETQRREIFFDAPLDQMAEHKRERDSQQEDDALNPEPSKIWPINGGGQGTVGTGIVKSADDFNSTNSYYASVSFTKTVGFVWRGRLSNKQLEKVRAQIRGAKQRGLRVRYWDTPSWPINLRNYIWHTLMTEGADMLNGDDLKGMAVENWKARVHGFW